MANPNPCRARAAKAKKARARRAGSVDDARRALWRGVEAVDRVLDDATDDPALVLRAVHALTQSASAYARLVEASELAARVEALEQVQAEHDLR